MANKKAFVSYSRDDKNRIKPLLDALRRRCDVWLDDEIRGGQEWWDRILAHIRDSDVVVVALSPAHSGSKPCSVEFDYSRAVGRPILPVKITRVSDARIWAEISRLQIIDYTVDDGNAVLALIEALEGLPDPPPLPDPLPESPPIPIPELQRISARIQQGDLTSDEQREFVNTLTSSLNQRSERTDAIDLLKKMRAMRGLLAVVDDMIDEALASLESQTRERIKKERRVSRASTPTTTASAQAAASPPAAASPLSAVSRSRLPGESEWMAELRERRIADDAAREAARKVAVSFVVYPAWWAVIVLSAAVLAGTYLLVEWAFVSVLTANGLRIAHVSPVWPVLATGLAFTCTYAAASALQYAHDPRTPLSAMGKGLFAGYVPLLDPDGFMQRIYGILAAFPIGPALGYLLSRGATFAADMWLGPGHEWLGWTVLAIATTIAVVGYIAWMLDDTDLV